MLERPLAVVPASRWWAGFLAIGALAAFMSGLAYVECLPSVFGVTGVDKAAHFALAGLLAFFLDGALRRRKLPGTGSFTIPLAAAMVLTPVALEEFLQRYTIYRTSSIWDFAADVAGVLVFIPLSRRAAA
jgi:VanZ family protein